MSRRLSVSLGSMAALALVVVGTAAALRFTDESYLTPTGVVGTPYTHRFGAPPPGQSGAGCDPPYIFHVDTGALPPGLSLGSRDGLVSGTPTQAGRWSFWLSIRDDPTDKPWCNPLSAEREFSITVIEGLTIGPESAAPGTVGTPYTLSMTANLPQPKTWSVVDGSLPPGLALGPSDGVISGTPTAAGSYPFTIRAVVDAQRSDTTSLTIVVRDPLAIVEPGSTGRSGSTELPRSEVGVLFRLSFSAAGGSRAYSWSLTAGSLPQGLRFVPDGRIVGRPRVAGEFDFGVSVADDEGRSASYDGSLAVARRLEIRIPRPLRPARAGRPYRWRFVAVGGVQPTTWKVARGPLPRGLRLDRELGVLAGVPRRSGRYRFRIQAVDDLGVTSTRTFLLKVQSAQVGRRRS